MAQELHLLQRGRGLLGAKVSVLCWQGCALFLGAAPKASWGRLKAPRGALEKAPAPASAVLGSEGVWEWGVVGRHLPLPPRF